MLKLYILPGTDGILSLSPFSYKAASLLAMSKADYEYVYEADTSKTPNGKLPVLQDGDKIIADSSIIQTYLEDNYCLDVDNHLTAEEKAIAQAFRVMFEERTYWAGVHSRLVNPTGSDFVRKVMLAGLPEEAKTVAAQQLRENSIQQMYGHGIGRHAPEQIYAFAISDIQAVLTYLGDKPFFFGDEPTTIDATLVGVLANALQNQFDNPLSDFINSKPEIAAYVKRFEVAVFGARKD